ncbi:SPOR domain-containing protein [Thiocystis violacea]|uniref:SPOR domain-containing protein n=1 Tax=Thiocystis violacea TaxID=13725 RepID=UPI001906A7F3|nr:SPOR domain-containing protein [Thiocystis violacea]MBK1717922.1 hypothetical protein [Thiocystis violacea]
MQEGAKKRLAGAVVIVALAVIFVPMLFEDESLVPPQVQGSLPSEPDFQDPFDPDAPPPLVEEPMETEDVFPVAESEPPMPPAPDEEFAQIDEELLGEPGQLGQAATPNPPSPVVGADPTRPRTAAPPAVARPAPAPAPKPAQPPKKESAPEPRARDDGMPSWVVQVSSLGSSEAADKLVGKLKQSGFSAFVEKAQVGGKTYYRVRVGPDSDRANAERTATMLRQKQKMDTLIQRYP